MLFPYVSPNRAETGLSFAARLAAIHTGGRLVPFLNDLGINAVDFARGDKKPMFELFEQAGVSTDQLMANTPISIGKARYRLRGEIISADFLSNPRTVFCPMCLVADDRSGSVVEQGRIGRYEWPLRIVRTCNVHNVALIERPRCSWDDQFHELSVRVPERGAALEALAASTTRRSVSDLQAYALARLEGARGPEWMDRQTIEQAVRTTELLGALIEFGTSKNVSALTSDEWDQAGREGFEFTSRGEAGIHEALYRVQDAFRATGKRPMHRNVFGRLYEWVGLTKSAKEPGDIKRIVREHIFQTVAVAPGEEVLGECLSERRLHSTASLATETGLHPKTLGYVLMAKGLVSADDPAAVFDAKVGRELAATVHRLVNVISVPKVLNCSRPQASGLIEERILLSIATGEAGAPGRTQKAVDERSIKIFLGALKAGARSVDEVPLGLVTISKAAEKVKAPCVDIVHLILGGFLSDVVTLKGDAGYAAIHVDPAEVGDVIRANLPGVSPSQAAAKIGIPARAVWALIDEDQGAVLPSVLIAGRKGNHVIRRVMLEDVCRFRDQYVKSGDIANQLETDRKTVEKMLRRYRVKLAYSESQIGMNLYRPGDLPQMLRPDRSSATS